VVNHEAARQMREQLGVLDPVGTTVVVPRPLYVKQKDVSPGEVEVVGVIRDERVGALHDPPVPVIYVPLAQVPRPEIKLIVRTRGEPRRALPGIREAIQQVDPNLAVADVRTLSEVRERSLSGTRQPAFVVGAFAAVAALLAALGLYGVLSHLVAQRRREIGIRMALGARQWDVLAHVLKNASSMVALGLVLGTLGAIGLTRMMQSILFEVSPLDPAVFAGAGVSMALISIVAGVVPAGRAASVPPIEALRHEG
jgi:putative ABC transport system permease protein